jgi:hypothetical protein
MNKRIFLTLTAVLITGTVLYKMPSQAGGDAESANLRTRQQRNWSDDGLPPRGSWRRIPSSYAPTFVHKPVQGNIQYLQEQTIEQRKQLATERAGKVRELLDPVITTETMPFLSQIVMLFGNLIQWLNQDYVELLKQINDEREWANTLYNVSTMYNRNTDAKIEALEKKVTELEAAAFAPTEY